MDAPSSASSFAVTPAGNGSDAESQMGSNGVAARAPAARSVGTVLSAVPVSVAVTGTKKLQSPQEMLAAPVAVPVSDSPVTVT